MASTTFSSGTLIQSGWLNDVNNHVYDILPNAVGDGITNDTTAFQAAVTAASGGTLYLPEGTFLVNKITLPASIEIVGKGIGTVIKLAAGVNDHLLYSNQGSYITLRNLVLDGNKSNQTVGAVSRCFYALDTSNIRVEDVTIQNASDHGAHVSTGGTSDPLTDSQYVWMTRVKAINNGTTTAGGNGGSGIAITAKYIWLTDCYASGNILAGIKVTGSYLTASGCYAVSNSSGGFTSGFDTVTEEGAYHTYISCFALSNGNGTDGGDGFRHQGQVDYITHRDCVAIGNTWSGISVLASSAVKATNINIFGGTIKNNGTNFVASSTQSGAGVFVSSTVASPNVPSVIRLRDVTITDDQGSKTQTFALEAKQGDQIYVGDGCSLSGNLTQSINIATTQVTNLSLSPNIVGADFIARSNTAVSVTGTLTETDLQSIVIPASTLCIKQRYRVRARGSATGTAGTKSIRLYWGNANSLVSSQAAGDQQEWSIDGYVEINSAGSNKCAATCIEIGGQTTNVMLTNTTNISNAITCKVTGTLGNVADTITCSSFYFEPIY